MNLTEINGRMSEYLLKLNGVLGRWLKSKIPKFADADDWWNEVVVEKVTPRQRDILQSKGIHDIDGLDLAATLRVIDRNWFAINRVCYINSKEREHIQDMMSVRNRWAHISIGEINRENLTHDLDLIADTLEGFDASQNDTRSIRALAIDIEDGTVQLDVTESASKQAEDKMAPQVSEHKIPDVMDTAIHIGSIVELRSEPSHIGVVTGIFGSKYSVFIDGGVQEFYAEQVTLHQEKKEDDTLTLMQARAALTAYQISNPARSNLYSLNSARIDFIPYQFHPALKMIKADVPHILVADDVGVGKTIEAGLILKELEARIGVGKRGRQTGISVLVICPKPLVAEHKWLDEMKRFDENFEELDGASLAQCISDTNRDLCWPDNKNKVIVPYSLFNEDVVMGTKSKSSRKGKRFGLMDLDPLPHFDLVIVDEAHTIRNPNTWMYKGVQTFCQNAGAIIFLTATPVQNSNQDLYTLLNLLRPDIVTDKKTFELMSEPNVPINRLLRVIRTPKDDWKNQAMSCIQDILKTTWGKNVIQNKPAFQKIYDTIQQKETLSRDDKITLLHEIEELHTFNTMINRTRRKDIEENFCVRRTETLRVSFSPAQKALYDSLMDFEATALGEIHGTRNLKFMMCAIMRQAASCIYGLSPFLDDLIQKRLNELSEDGELYEYDDIDNFYKSKGTDAIHDLAEEVRVLARELPSEDPKLNKLMEVICQKQQDENRRVIIFSSFHHTLSYLQKNLEKIGVRVGRIDGNVPDEERRNLRERFMKEKDEEGAIDVMLFSEVGCEGLDYQFCDTMINYDLPWNPMRIEQRIGRIDRRGQKSKVVKICNMITEDTIDARIYDKCLSKIGIFKDSIGDCGEIFGEINSKITEIMLDPELTKEEQDEKIEQLADNEVRSVQEMRRMETEERNLYGFDLSKYTKDEELQDAENEWINSRSIQEMVTVFLNDYLGEGEYIRGAKKENKTLRLSQLGRRKLLQDLSTQDLDLTNNAVKRWNGYLRSVKPLLPITFESSYANENRDVTFITPTHPLAVQAASYESSERRFPFELYIHMPADAGERGHYPFLIYAWQYRGIHSDIKLVPVCEDAQTEKTILDDLMTAEQADANGQNFDCDWKALDGIHYAKWAKEKERFVRDIQNECNYRQDQLTLNYKRQQELTRRQLEKSDDDRIRTMYEGQLRNQEAAYNEQYEDISKAVKEADIITTLLVKGVLYID